MKPYFKRLLLVASCLVAFNASWAQSKNSPMDDMVNAIENARVADMVKYFDAYVPITINSAPAIYSHNQAEIVLKDFFEKNAPKSFEVTDNGAPDANSKYIIATYTTTASTKYSAYILLKMKDGDFVLQQFTMNKE